VLVSGDVAMRRINESACIKYCTLSVAFFLEQMSFHGNFLTGGVSPEICELRYSGVLTELEVDDWIDCICCT
jgi:hypothetical protein